MCAHTGKPSGHVVAKWVAKHENGALATTLKKGRADVRKQMSAEVSKSDALKTAQNGACRKVQSMCPLGCPKLLHWQLYRRECPMGARKCV